MATDLNSAGITRSGSSGNYIYSVMMNSGSSANRPITYVTWLDAARFANWMANGQPTGEQNSTTTENGAYNLNGAMDGNAVVKIQLIQIQVVHHHIIFRPIMNGTRLRFIAHKKQWRRWLLYVCNRKR